MSVSAITLILLLAAVVAALAASATAHHVRRLRREIAGLREEVLATRVSVPAARPAPALEEVRIVVAEALAEERERELAEARAFWAAQEIRDELDGVPQVFSGLEYEGSDLEHPGHHEDAETLDFPGFQGYAGYEVSTADAALLDALLGDTGADAPQGSAGSSTDDFGFIDARHQENADSADAVEQALPFLPQQGTAEEAEDHRSSPSAGGAHGTSSESAERRAARRRHPSDPNYSLSGEPVLPSQAVAPRTASRDHEHTVERLSRLAQEATVLSDVRSGPLGTLDVYVFDDDTTVCLTPGHRETADRLSRALDEGEAPVLLGGSGVSGAYALTFACGEETVYVLADRVIASR